MLTVREREEGRDEKSDVETGCYGLHSSHTLCQISSSISQKLSFLGTKGRYGQLQDEGKGQQ